MAHTHSPLRYPGGKSCLYPLVTAFLRANALQRSHYAEPYAGGSSLALGLLLSGQVSDIHLNDIDAGIWSFWHSVLQNCEAFCELAETTPISVDEWHRQRAIYKASDASDPLKLGFATFFLNRTNRSGIIGTGGIIGGLKQEGNYKIDCRFNKTELARRIRRIHKYRNQIHLTRFDALDFLDHVERVLPKRTFTAIDPPYFEKGASLYTSFYTECDHADVASKLMNFNKPWVLTYDDAPQIRKLYSARRQFSFDIKYSVQTKRMGTELLIASKGLKIPPAIRDQLVHRPQYRNAA